MYPLTMSLQNPFEPHGLLLHSLISGKINKTKVSVDLFICVYISLYFFRLHVTIQYKTRGQRPNESQKAVIIYMMKSVGEIASKMWPVV